VPTPFVLLLNGEPLCLSIGTSPADPVGSPWLEFGTFLKDPAILDREEDCGGRVFGALLAPATAPDSLVFIEALETGRVLSTAEVLSTTMTLGGFSSFLNFFISRVT
jgi:hypothetical protein